MEIGEPYMYTMKGKKSIRFWAFAALVAGLVVIPLLARKKEHRLASDVQDSNKRYDIDEYIADEQL